MGQNYFLHNKGNANKEFYSNDLNIGLIWLANVTTTISVMQNSIHKETQDQMKIKKMLLVMFAKIQAVHLQYIKSIAPSGKT